MGIVGVALNKEGLVILSCNSELIYRKLSAYDCRGILNACALKGICVLSAGVRIAKSLPGILKIICGYGLSV